MQEWRCEKCNKVKDLRGPHLNGKVSVRSDCWPCAKKTTFKLTSAASGHVDPVADLKKAGASPDKSAVSVTAPPAPFLFSTPPLASVPPAAATTKSAAPSPFGTITTSSGGSATSTFQFGGGKTGNPFTSAAATTSAVPTTLVNPFLNVSSIPAPSSANTKASGGIVMQQPASSGKGPNPSPPFSFVAASKQSAAVPPVALGPSTMPAFTVPSAGVLTAGAVTAKATGEPTWRCTTCGKVKDLRGPHLNGKTTVRSDCWPCAKKRTFVLYDPDGKALGAVVETKRQTTAVEKSPALVTASSSNSECFNSIKSPQSALIPPTPTATEHTSTADTLVTCSSFDATPVRPYDPTKRGSQFNWREPDIPSPVTVRNFFMDSLTNKAPSNSEFSLSLTFYEKMVSEYMKGLRTHRFERAVPVTWDSQRSIMYVVCSDFTPKQSLSSPLSVQADGLGDFASLLMYVDSTVQNVKRIFCSDVFAFAATALYHAHVNSSIKVFGPARDMTSQPTTLEEVIRVLDVQTRVTSGEVRNEAVKKLWGAHGVAVLPSSAVGEAIRSIEEPSADDNGVDVVLLSKTATREDYQSSGSAFFRLLME
eukprot:CAMPEP_0176438598 /NCGR_PEP_ID=MMETSP0127-20121128/19393_1 /TAXON_ID=938130 /ORGANISM="Platyophrya macrostoma, Strain WH" /LENGTH=591 /DNA_ID=CAMNT_0017822607 /DNA_START=168 /DNA_END=1943 /DNA_ORIENTATION=+